MFKLMDEFEMLENDDLLIGEINLEILFGGFGFSDDQFLLNVNKKVVWWVVFFVLVFRDGVVYGYLVIVCIECGFGYVIGIF